MTDKTTDETNTQVNQEVSAQAITDHITDHTTNHTNSTDHDDGLMVVVTRQPDQTDHPGLGEAIEKVVIPNPCPETLERGPTATPTVVPLPRHRSDLIEDLILTSPATEAVETGTPPSPDDDLDEQPSTKQSTGHRDHLAFRAVRRAIFLGDLVCALSVLVGALVWTEGKVWVMPAAWLAMSVLRAGQSDRMADLLDRRPFLKMNSHLAFAVVILAVAFGSRITTREVLVASAVLAAGGLLVRTIIRRLTDKGRWTTQLCETVLVVGSMESVRRTINEWKDLQTVDVVGACLGSRDPDVLEIDGVPVLGRVSEVESVASHLGADIVALHDVEHLGGLRLARLQYALEETGTQLSVITPVTNMRVDRASVRLLGRRVVMDISYGKPGGLARVVKTALDQILSLVLIVMMLPIMLVSVVLVRLTSRGPAIFKQVRVGEGGTTFVMYKLRTMHRDAEARLEALLDQNEVGGGLFKIADDPRMTKVGKWLRKFSIDELPQLFNVLKGEMSLIGPRPALPREVQTYDDAARRRLAVKPGITGLWQVSGRSNLSWAQSVRIDSDYVDNWRPARELSIAMLTIKAIVTRNGAH